MKVTPQFIVTLDSDIHVISEATWKRVAANLTWDRLMKVAPPSESLRRVFTWILATAKIYPEGRGGNTRFDDLAMATHSIENENAGTGLRLTKNELEDNQMASIPGKETLDYAREWASQVGNAAAFWPEQALYALIKAGITALAYDGLPFFSKVHTLNANGGGGTYSNIVENVDITPTSGATAFENLYIAQENFGKALSAVAAQKFIGGIPRYLKPTAMVVPTALQFRAEQLLGTQTLTHNDNVLSRRNVELIVNPLLDDEPDVYYLGVADMMSDDLAPFVYWDRQPFAMRSYSLMDEAELSRRDEFEWHMKGRNGTCYGHPYLFYRCLPGAAP